MRIVRVGSRDSKLAIIQAEMVIEAIKKHDASIRTELVLMKTTGDKILDRTLDKIGGKGLFVKELDDALLNDQVDITVHSGKDLPAELPEQLPLVAFSKRADERDVLILPQGELDESKPWGCSSKRRTCQLLELGFENIQPLRGNVQTRLRKLDSGEYRGIILAAAGIERLGLQERISRYFTTEELIPAACQGIVVVQSRYGEDTSYLRGFHVEESKIVATAERAYIKALDGGCSSPVAAYARVLGGKIHLVGLYVDETGSIIRRGVLQGELAEAESLGIRLAEGLKNGTI